MINPESEFSACAVLDINGDGCPDIFCGGFWYEGPNWKRHVTREVPKIRGRYDDYSNLPLDVNRDGRLDIVSVNYRSQSLFWVEQPSSLEDLWKTHLIDQPGPSETGRLYDLDGDGQLDILPNGTQFAAWYRLERSAAAGSVVWGRHDLPPEIAGHGIGFGDVDGDGRGDLVTPSGWWQARPEPTHGWQRMPEFTLHRDSSIPILVVDVDGDGDRDLIWGRGHNIGLYWMEQRQLETQRTWQQHAIDTSWSSAHSLLWADLDGDGREELVAGKRYLGHDGKDPGEWDRLQIMAYAFQPETRTWHGTRISSESRCGMDLDPVAADVDLDGDLDLVAPSRAGLWLLENRHTRRPAEATDSQPTPVADQAAEIVDSASSRADEPLLMLRVGPSESRRIESRTDWGLRRWQILRNLERVMGPLPNARARVPLDVVVESREAADGYTRVRLTYRADSDTRVPAYLLIPDGLRRPAAAMLCLHPTHPLGKGVVCGLGGQPSRFYAHELAQARLRLSGS